MKSRHLFLVPGKLSIPPCSSVFCVYMKIVAVIYWSLTVD